MKTADISDSSFRKAVEAIDEGNLESLQQLITSDPTLVAKPLDTPYETGYFKNPYLLWFVANNPIRQEKMRANIVDITKLIIDTLQKDHHDNYEHIIDYTLGLVATGRIPKECGVQIPLMELLVSKGANTKGSVLGVIGQHNFEAATFLLDKGARYNLATAVGFNSIEDVKSLVKTATVAELYVALVVASFFGKADIIILLIAASADPNGSASEEDFGGFHAHASTLHQAVFSGSLQAVELLVKAGANLDAVDKVYNGTPLGWATHMQTEEKDEMMKNNFTSIAHYLSDRKNGAV